MARLRRNTGDAPDHIDPNKAPYHNCDHCGTVVRALRIWTADELDGCDCGCHRIRKLHAWRERLNER